jgi:1-deoxy-D-xylulose 5-phosphate reductoisomerase
MKKLKKIILLGATGSIGKTTLELLRLQKDKFKLIGVSANTNVKKLKTIVDEFNVKYIAISD